MLELPYLKSIEGLSHRFEDLYSQVNSLKTGESKIVTVIIGFNTLKLLLSGSTFQTEGKKYKLIAFQNINEAIDETESQAWQKLLSVLTHEIMNSIAPISSLADTLKNLLKSAQGSNYLPLEDLELGIGTIKSRSEGLLKFAEIYRSLNKISKPDRKKIYVRDLFENLHQLMQPMLSQKNIELEIVLKDPHLVLEADPSLLEQVLINLIVNAIDAVKDRSAPRIVLSSAATEGKTLIKVVDNGKGMAEEIIEQIFVPFFSTKKNGSGIGLTLCKQIMMLHHGNIQVQSVENEGTAFVLQL
jgi:signal transduction histidine kinase